MAVCCCWRLAGRERRLRRRWDVRGRRAVVRTDPYRSETVHAPSACTPAFGLQSRRARVSCVATTGPTAPGGGSERQRRQRQQRQRRRRRRQPQGSQPCRQHHLPLPPVHCHSSVCRSWLVCVCACAVQCSGSVGGGAARSADNRLAEKARRVREIRRGRADRCRVSNVQLQCTRTMRVRER